MEDHNHLSEECSGLLLIRILFDCWGLHIGLIFRNLAHYSKLTPYFFGLGEIMWSTGPFEARKCDTSSCFALVASLPCAAQGKLYSALRLLEAAREIYTTIINRCQWIN